MRGPDVAVVSSSDILLASNALASGGQSLILFARGGD
jgi:hypothetical protein